MSTLPGSLTPNPYSIGAKNHNWDDVHWQTYIIPITVMVNGIDRPCQQLKQNNHTQAPIKQLKNIEKWSRMVLQWIHVVTSINCNKYTNLSANPCIKKIANSLVFLCFFCGGSPPLLRPLQLATARPDSIGLRAHRTRPWENSRDFTMNSLRLAICWGWVQ